MNMNCQMVIMKLFELKMNRVYKNYKNIMESSFPSFPTSFNLTQLEKENKLDEPVFDIYNQSTNPFNVEAG